MQTIDLKRIPDHHARVGKTVLPRQPDITEPTDTVTVRVDQIAGIFSGHGLARWEPKEQRFWSGLLPEGKTVPIPGWERGTWCDVAMLDGTRLFVRESFDSLRARWVAALSPVRDIGTDPVAVYGALVELVNLKELKDSLGKTDDYERRQPLAWDRARRALGISKPPAASPVTGGDQVSSDPKLCRCWYSGWGNDIIDTVFTCRYCGSKATLVGGRWTSGKWAITPPPAATPPPPTQAGSDQAPPPAHPASDTPAPAP